MLHHGSCLFCDRADVTLGHAVLMVRAGTREGEPLFIPKRLLEFRRLEYPVVPMVSFDANAA